LAKYCSVCGQPVRQDAVSGGSVSVQTLASHVRVMGILWAVYGAYEVLMAFANVTMSRFYLSLFQNLMPPNASIPVQFLSLVHVILVWGAVWAFVSGAVGGFAAWTLLRREPYGRTVALIAAFLALLMIPLGTGIGVYTLIELLPVSARDGYMQLATR
jgi:hypothetical protein